MKTIGIYNYINYKDFLKESIQRIQANSPVASLEYLAKRFGLRSRGFLHNVISGKRNLSLSSARTIAKSLKLSRPETEYFEKLVQLSFAKSTSEKHLLLQRIYTELHRHQHKDPELRTSLHRRSEYHLTWYYPVIRAMTGIQGFKPEGEWISKKLKQAITPAQASKAVEQLLTWGYLRKDQTGQIHEAEKKSWIDDSEANFAMKVFLKEMLGRAIEALEYPREERAYGSLLVRCSRDKIPQAQALISEFVKRFDDLVEAPSAEKASDVYFLETSFFELTKKGEFK